MPAPNPKPQRRRTTSTSVQVLPLPSAAQASALSSLLLAWYQVTRRDLPWRRNPEPYAIWVSEVMLQQTQVATVKPYFERWMKAFPTLQSLAQAEEAHVLALWQGLGYYSRARSLQRGARHVVEQLGGQIPDHPEALRTLPGVGPYTAGAIASIAFERDAPLVDGNVARVLTRLFALPGPVQKPPLNKHLWVLADALIPKGRARDFNQALMELGALCCTPQKPRCIECPVRKHCNAYARAEVELFPTPQARPKVTEQQAVAALVARGDTWLIGRLPENAPRWAGMWQFPNREIAAGESQEQAIEHCLEAWTGSRGSAKQRVFSLKHSVTRYRIELHGLISVLPSNAARTLTGDTWQWVTPAAAESLAMPAAHRKLMRFLAKHDAGSDGA